MNSIALRRKDFDQQATKPTSIAGLGIPPPMTVFQTKQTPQMMALTRHHVIPHGVLIDAWEHAVARGDLDVLHAFALWGGKNPATDLPPTLQSNTPDPQIVLRFVAWNPFNIVFGPLSEHRVDDPGPEFDHFEFRNLVPASSGASPAQLRAESLARLDFNRHLGILRRIYNLLVRYLANQVATQDVAGLCALLRSDVPTRYANLGARFATGALLSPDLWADYSTTPNIAPADKFAAASTRAQGFARKKAVIVPWNAASWLPEVDPVLPLADRLDMRDTSVWATGAPNPPPEAQRLGELATAGLTEAQLRVAIVKAARQSGRFKARVCIFGPRGTLDETARLVASELKKLNREGYDLKIDQTFFNATAPKVCFYSA